jgi:hypothetical protein
MGWIRTHVIGPAVHITLAAQPTHAIYTVQSTYASHVSYSAHATPVIYTTHAAFTTHVTYTILILVFPSEWVLPVRKDPMDGTPVRKDHEDPPWGSPEAGRQQPEVGRGPLMGSCTTVATRTSIRIRDGNMIHLWNLQHCHFFF